MSALPQTQRLSLEEAIQQQINLGERDPLTIARRLADLHGTTWVAEELAGHWEEILAEIARQRLGSERRSSIAAIGARNGKTTKREVVLASLFIPSRGYIALGDATESDLIEAEMYRRRLADGLVRWADYYLALRELLASQGVEKVRQIRGSLPELPGAPGQVEQ